MEPRTTLGGFVMNALRLALALIAAVFGYASAQADPMRPLVAPAAASAAATNIPRDSNAGSRGALDLPPLLAIREDSGGQRRALIGETWLQPGDKLGTRQVLAIAVTSVTLAGDKSGPNGKPSRQTLYLLPPLQRAPAPSTP